MQFCIQLSPDEAIVVRRAIGRYLQDPHCPAQERVALERALLAIGTSMQIGSDKAEEHAGFIDWTIDDENYEPYGRQFELRVYYDWVREDSVGRLSPPSEGYAEVAEIEVLAARYFNAAGDAVSVDRHHADVAWDLVQQQLPRIENACTRNGPAAENLQVASGRERDQNSAPRLAPSVRQRNGESRRRASG